MAKTTKSQARTKRERSEFLWGWLFILPTTIGLIVLNIIPIFQTIYQSFFKTGDFGKGNIFIGLQNYQKVFSDKEILEKYKGTDLERREYEPLFACTGEAAAKQHKKAHFVTCDNYVTMSDGTGIVHITCIW